MTNLTSTDIQNWAQTVDCKVQLPQLIRRLIFATINMEEIKHIHFPHGEDVSTGGYDGELLVNASNAYVPIGESVWEFGTTNNKKGKADEDYEKRKAAPLGKISKFTTYINVNGKKYRDKSKWEHEKRSEAFWKDVRYYDAVDLEHWINLAPSVELWLAEKIGIPTYGIYTFEQYWNRWSKSDNQSINHRLLLGGSRSIEFDAVQSFFNDETTVLYIKSITTDEAAVFPIAVSKELSNETLNERAIIIDNRESFKFFSQTKKSFIIIAKCKLESVDLQDAKNNNHKVIIPIGPSDEVTSDNKITLNIISLDNFESALLESGVNSEHARLLTKNSGRNVAVLKRLMKFDDGAKPKYLDSINVEDIIPILLVNQFSENFTGDLETIQELSGKNYDDYSIFLKKLLNVEDSPLYYINGNYRLISQSDAFLYLAKFITREHLRGFKEIVIKTLTALTSQNAVRNHRLVNSPQLQYSPNLLRGLCQSLTVIAVFGDKFGLNSSSTSQNYVDSIVDEILSADTTLWIYMSENLTLLAEASPEVYLQHVLRIFENKTLSLFIELKNDFWGPSNNLAPLLWSLDVLAWFPEYLLKVSDILCKIISISPDNFPTSNTPQSNLKSIFRIWYPQTNADSEDRVKILNYLLNKYPQTTYNLINSLIKIKNDHAPHTQRPIYRLFSELREIRVSHTEYKHMLGFCLDKFIELSATETDRILALIDGFKEMNSSRIETALKVIESYEFMPGDQIKVYSKLRRLIGHNRSYSSTNWALAADDLDNIETTANKIKPKSKIVYDQYLFEEASPEMIEGRKFENFDKQNEYISSKRLEFLEYVILNYNIEKIFELAANIQHPEFYGFTLAQSEKLSKDEKLKIYALLESNDETSIKIATRFVQISENKTDFEESINNYKRLESLSFSINAKLRFLNSLKPCLRLWKFISDLDDKEIEELYWQSKRYFLYTDSVEELRYALTKLTSYQKPYTFINTLGWGCYVHKDKIASEEILSLMENLSFENSVDKTPLDSHNFIHILNLLQERDDYNIERGAKIEIKFMDFFVGPGSYHKPINLFKLMERNSEEYYQFIKLLNIGNEDISLDIPKNFNNTLKMAAYQILDSYDKIPSLTEDGQVNIETLNNWLVGVRSLAAVDGNEKNTELWIGKLLAKYPINMSENIGYHDSIYKIIDEGSDELKFGFRVQISNNLGFTSRVAFEGGNIERKRAQFFELLMNETKFLYPSVSNIFKFLKNNYLFEAKSEDEDALMRSLG